MNETYMDSPTAETLTEELSESLDGGTFGSLFWAPQVGTEIHQRKGRTLTRSDTEAAAAFDGQQLSVNQSGSVGLV